MTSEDIPEQLYSYELKRGKLPQLSAEGIKLGLCTLELCEVLGSSMHLHVRFVVPPD